MKPVINFKIKISILVFTLFLANWRTILDLSLLHFLPSRSLLSGWKRGIHIDELPGYEKNVPTWLIAFSVDRVFMI